MDLFCPALPRFSFLLFLRASGDLVTSGHWVPFRKDPEEIMFLSMTLKMVQMSAPLNMGGCGKVFSVVSPHHAEQDRDQLREEGMAPPLSSTYPGPGVPVGALCLVRGNR